LYFFAPIFENFNRGGGSYSHDNKELFSALALTFLRKMEKDDKNQTL
jgi:hypothetical protein